MEPLSIQRLSTLLSTSPPPFIFIHDPYTALASTYLKSNLSSIASTSQTVWVNIDCIECFTPRLLYTRIINALSGWDAHLEEGGGECWGGIERGRWDMSWDVFVQALKDVHVEILSRDGGNKKERDEGVSLSDDDEQLRFVLIFEKAERMKDFLPSLVVPITRLAELAEIPLTTIFISPIPWTTLRPPNGASPEPYLVHVPPLAKEETIAYIVSLFPSPPAKSGSINYYHPSLQPLYGQFVESLYSVCALSTTDPGELAYIAAARWPGFVNPLLEDWRVERSRRVEAKRSLNLDETMEIDELDSNDHDEDIDREPYALPSPDEHLRLLRLFSSTFTTAASALIPRTSDARTWALENAPPSTLRLSQPFGAASDPSIKRTAVTTQNVGIDGLGLGRKTKTLIVAAFVASFNPARTDVRMFVRADAIGKKKKKRGGPRKMKPGAVAKLPQRLVGPQAFSLERLVNIFGSILAEEDRDEPDFLRAEVSRVHFLSTITELIQMKLLHRTNASSSSIEKLDMSATLLKCNLEFEVVQRVAKSISVDLGVWLWDAEGY